MFETLIKELKSQGISFKENEDMATHSTMRITAFAKIFIEIQDLQTLKKVLAILKNFNIKTLIIGSGSNTLFSKDFDGIVLQMNIKGQGNC